MNELSASGLRDRQIAELTGVGRGTVNAWRHGRGVVRHLRVDRGSSGLAAGRSPAYCHLLGSYLGDGCITVASSRGVSLVVTLDAECPLIVNEVAAAMRGVVDEAWGDPAQPDGR